MNRRQAILKACLLLRRQDKEESLAKFLLMYMLDETSEQFSNKLSEELSVEQENRYFDLINKNINVPNSAQRQHPQRNIYCQDVGHRSLHFIC